MKTNGQKGEACTWTCIRHHLLVSVLATLLFLGCSSLAAPREAFLKISSDLFRLDPLPSGITSSLITARGELLVEVVADTCWRLQWEISSEDHQITSPLGQEVSGKGARWQRIPLIWKFDWMTTPGLYEVPINIILEITGQERIIQRELLKLKVPFLAVITPQSFRRLHITDDHHVDRQLSLQIHANAPWVLQVEVTKSHENLALVCNSLYHSAATHFLSSTPVLVLPNQIICLARGEAGGDHRLVLDWQKAPSAPLRAGDYPFYLRFSVLPAQEELLPKGGDY
ncbi:MAG TPA: hypothetical protein VIL66_01535 [Bacillota bacterium]